MAKTTHVLIGCEIKETQYSRLIIGGEVKKVPHGGLEEIVAEQMETIRELREELALARQASRAYLNRRCRRATCDASSILGCTCTMDTDER